ncbi:unnamed protein product [Pseudomonas synxantha]|nr:unnamed protein product [Pseudomonas synxantha]
MIEPSTLQTARHPVSINSYCQTLPCANLV